jgi:hypothetical protein
LQDRRLASGGRNRHPTLTSPTNRRWGRRLRGRHLLHIGRTEYRVRCGLMTRSRKLQ